MSEVELDNTMNSLPFRSESPSHTDRPQRLHLVFGGELETLEGMTFRDLEHLDVVGIFPDYASAHAAWKGAAQKTVDNAVMRYFIVHLHRLLDPRDAVESPHVS